VYRGLSLAGFHGYDPAEDDMAAIFMVFGRGAMPGARLPAVHTVDVAPTVLALLDQPIPAWMEGSPIPAIVRAVEPSAAPAAGPGSVVEESP